MVGVGTMNCTHTPEQIVGGILEIVNTCHEKQPQAETLVMVSGVHHFLHLLPLPRRLSFCLCLLVC